MSNSSIITDGELIEPIHPGEVSFAWQLVTMHFWLLGYV